MNRGITIFSSAMTHFLSWALPLFYKVWSKSWRCNTIDALKLEQMQKSEKGIILVCWHGEFIPVFSLIQDFPITALASQGPRGDVIAKIALQHGHKTSLLPISGQGNAFRHMYRVLKNEPTTAIAVDGPLGPDHQVKHGIIKLASRLGYSIVPISVDCSPKWVMFSRWDKRELPFFWAKVSLSVGEPIRVPGELTEGEFTDWATTVETALEFTSVSAVERLDEI